MVLRFSHFPKKIRSARMIRRTGFACRRIGRKRDVFFIKEYSMGSCLGDSFRETMGRIQSTGPDPAVMGDDFADDDSDTADRQVACLASGSLQTTYGVNFVYGNHDNGSFRQRAPDGFDDVRRPLVNGDRICPDAGLVENTGGQAQNRMWIRRF